MEAPVFDDIVDPSCECAACAGERRRHALAGRLGGGPLRRVRRAAASVVTAGCVAAGLTATGGHAAEDEHRYDEQAGGRPAEAGNLLGATTVSPGALAASGPDTRAQTMPTTPDAALPDAALPAGPAPADAADTVEPAVPVEPAAVVEPAEQPADREPAAFAATSEHLAAPAGTSRALRPAGMLPAAPPADPAATVDRASAGTDAGAASTDDSTQPPTAPSTPPLSDPSDTNTVDPTPVPTVENPTDQPTVAPSSQQGTSDGAAPDRLTGSAPDHTGSAGAGGPQPTPPAGDETAGALREAQSKPARPVSVAPAAADAPAVDPTVADLVAADGVGHAQGQPGPLRQDPSGAAGRSLASTSPTETRPHGNSPIDPSDLTDQIAGALHSLDALQFLDAAQPDLTDRTDQLAPTRPVTPTTAAADTLARQTPAQPKPDGVQPAATPVPTTRAQIIARAKTWVNAQVPYSMTKYHGGYRADCSGYVSMAWNIGTNAWTGSLASFAVPIAKGDLQSGDILLFHNPKNPVKGSHVVIFDKWVDAKHTSYMGYEQTPPHTMHRAIPYSYFNSSSFKPYRYKYLTDRPSTASAPTTFPGTQFFGPGAVNQYVTQLGQMLVDRGAARFYQEGPDPEWGPADLNATRAFQQAQGWTGEEADGIPGPDTWDLLVRGAGHDIADARSGRGTRFPGAQYFGPGRKNPYVTQLGRALVAKGYGHYYTKGPDPEWGEADRRNTQAFQRAQGWRGADADGIPGPETWRRLTS